MSHRLLTLLVILLLAAQAPVALSAIAPASAQHDCGDAAAHSAATKHCPHCLDMATSAAGCANLCAAALPTAALTVSMGDATVEFPSMAVATLFSRSDIPPTPPPIA